MKRLITILLCSTYLNISGQNPKVNFDGSKWNAPYTLNIPKGWEVERFLIPIEFAPQIPYKGVEDVRFAPGWGNPKSDDYWTYAFLWYLDDTQNINSSIIESNLKAYYTGLISINMEPRKIPADKLIPVKTSFKEIDAQKGDLRTFKGTISMLDYMEQKPITLNSIIHLKTCAGKSNTFIFNELSPKPYNDKVWQSLDQLWTDFICDKPADTK